MAGNAKRGFRLEGGLKTRDFVQFSEPLFVWAGMAEGWIGLCSPDLVRVVMFVAGAAAAL